jgi:predicted histone-like DNA-binding protein
MIKRGDYINPEGKKKTGYYPQVVRGKTVNLRELSERAASGTTLNKLEAEMALRMVIEHVEEELLKSNHVCFDGFGTFSLTAECRHVDDPGEIRAESIHVKRVVFIPSKILMKRIKKAKFVKASF